MGTEKSGGLPSFLSILTGISVGILVGLLVALSVSPVVATVVGALTALLTVFLGLGGSTQIKPKNDSEPILDTQKSLRIIGFCIACTLAVVCGLYIRTHNLLGLSVTDKITALKQAGLSEAKAQEFALRELVESGQSSTENDKVAPNQSTLSELFAASIAGGPAELNDLAEKNYVNPTEWAKAFSHKPGSLGEIGNALIHAEPDVQRDVLRALWNLLKGAETKE
jgi:hypothetical protein